MERYNPLPGPPLEKYQGCRLSLPKRGEENARITRIEHHIDSAGIFVFEQDVPPGTAAIGRFENPAFTDSGRRHALMPRQSTMSGFVGMHDQCADLPAIFQSNVFPILPTIDRFVNAVSKSDITANCGFARTNIDHVVVRLCDRQYPRWMIPPPSEKEESRFVRRPLSSRLRRRPPQNNKRLGSPANPLNR